MARDTSITSLDDADLLDRLGDTKQELFNLRFQHVTGQLDNSSRLGADSQETWPACMTEVRAREIAAAEAAQTEETV